MTQVSAVRDRKATFRESVANPVPIDYPDLVEAGDLLVVWATGFQSNPSVPGWTSPLTPVEPNWGELYYRTADGSEGGTTFDLTQEINTRDSNCIVWSIKGDLNPGTPEAAQSVFSSTADPVDPPSLSPTGGDRLYLWLVCVMIDANSILTTWDSTLSDRINWGGISGGGVGAFSGERLLEAASFDPASMTKSGNQEWSAFTVAIPVDQPAAGNFPVVESTSEGSWTTDAATQSMTLPSGIEADDVLVATIANQQGRTVSIDGWTEVTTDEEVSNVRGTMLQRVADGAEGATATVDFAGGTSNRTGSFICRRISGADGTKTEASASDGIGAFPTWPSLTPAEGADDNLWLADVAIDADRFLVGWAVNYGAAPLEQQDSNVVSEGVGGGALARNQATAAPIDGHINASDNWVTVTAAIYPSGSGPIPPPSGGGNRMGGTGAIRKPPRTPR